MKPRLIQDDGVDFRQLRQPRRVRRRLHEGGGTQEPTGEVRRTIASTASVAVRHGLEAVSSHVQSQLGLSGGGRAEELRHASHGNSSFNANLSGLGR
jgi:hypothetical protein